MKYLIILEPTATGYSAYSPDLDGCVAAGDDRDATIALMQEAVAFHLEGLAEEGSPVPVPRSEPAFVEVNAGPGATADQPHEG
jgi:predicted RNase H-like HicB family nuclease